jgi:hypothetical protein
MAGAWLRRTGRRWGLGLGFAAATGVVTALMGPFGNYEHVGLNERLIYWPAMALVSVVLFGGPLTIIEIKRPGWVQHWATPFAVGLFGCTILAVISRTVAVAMWPALSRVIAPLEWYGQCVVISMPVVFAYWFVAMRGRSALAIEAQSLEPPPSFRDALCLQMEDNYVRVHTEGGSRLVLMTLSDAIARTAKPGLQVHRSWWVAKDAVEGAVADGRNVRVRLKGGLEAPVARAKVADARAAGLIV